MPVHASIYNSRYCLLVTVTKHIVEGTVFQASPDLKGIPEHLHDVTLHTNVQAIFPISTV